MSFHGETARLIFNESVRRRKEEDDVSAYQQNPDGSWTPAKSLRMATWLEVMLDRWIGPRYREDGRPWACVLKGLTGRG